MWTVPWLWWAQYDASIEQPLIRNAGEALGVRASLNLSPDFPPDRLFRSSVALENLLRIEKMLRGSDPFSRTPRSFGGLTSPKWPSHLFPDDPDWKINPERVAKGRALYAKMCAECHLGPVADPVFDAQFPDKSFWKEKPLGQKPHWQQDPDGSWIVNEVTKSVAIMGTDPAQANVLAKRQVQMPEFLKMDPAKELGERWDCKKMETYSSTEMPFSIALMITVQRTSEKWLSDRGITDPKQIKEVWGERTNCPNTTAKEPRISRAAAERRLGDRALHPQRFGALAVLDADAAERAPDTVLHGRARLRSENGRVRRAGGRRRVMQDRPDPVLDDG